MNVTSQIIWTGVFQYCVMRVLMTIVSVLAQATGRYCEESMSPAFARIWVCLFLQCAFCSNLHRLTQSLDGCLRVYLRHNRNVLLDPILLSNQGRYQRQASLHENPLYQTGYFFVILAIGMFELL